MFAYRFDGRQSALDHARLDGAAHTAPLAADAKQGAAPGLTD